MRNLYGAAIFAIVVLRRWQLNDNVRRYTTALVFLAGDVSPFKAFGVDYGKRTFALINIL
jgi:hypothetical protein